MHKIIIISLHVSKDYEFLRISQYLHLYQSQIVWQNFLYALQLFKIVIESFDLFVETIFYFLLLCHKLNFLDFPYLLFKFWFLCFYVRSWPYIKCMDYIFLFYFWYSLYWLLFLLNLLKFVYVTTLVCNSSSTHAHATCFLIGIFLLLLLGNMILDIVIGNFNFSLHLFKFFINLDNDLLFFFPKLLVDRT